MQKKLNIGVLCNNISHMFQRSLYESTLHWGKKLGVNLFVFEGRQIYRGKFTEVKANSTFQLAKTSILDGIIFHPLFTFLAVEDYENWTSALNSKPKVAINKIVEGASSVIVDNRHGIKLMLQHLTKDHGYKKVAFVKGPENYHESIERLDAYRAFMDEADLLHEEFIFDGGFEVDQGIKSIKHILKQDLQFDAILFSNDQSAIAAQDYVNNVYPDLVHELHICGFDDSPHAQLSTPQLTSVAQPYDEVARSSLEIIIDMIENQAPARQVVLPTKLVIRNSCGCTDIHPPDMSTLRLIKSPYSIQENIDAFKFDELFEKLTVTLKYLTVSSCYVVLFETPFSFDNQSTLPDISVLRFVYTNHDRQIDLENQKFFTDQLLPQSIIDSEEVVGLAVKPLFYQNEHTGYIVFNGHTVDEADMEEIRSHLAITIRTVTLFEGLDQVLKEKNKALNKISLLNDQLSVINFQLEQKYKTDEQTGTFNRRGFFSVVEDRLNDKRITMPITIFYADMDNLKDINDLYGHSAGDTAINIASTILKETFREQDIIARMGGDEFVIFTHGCSPNDIQQIIRRLNENIEISNKHNKEPFHIGISMGHHSTSDKDMRSIEKTIQSADKALYQQKQDKKTTKTSGSNKFNQV